MRFGWPSACVEENQFNGSQARDRVAQFALDRFVWLGETWIPNKVVAHAEVRQVSVYAVDEVRVSSAFQVLTDPAIPDCAEPGIDEVEQLRRSDHGVIDESLDLVHLLSRELAACLGRVQEGCLVTPFS